MINAEAQSLHRHAMEASSVGILIADALAPDMPLIYVNPAFERITGYSRAEALGRNCRFLQGEDRDQPGLEVIRAAMRGGTEANALLRNYRKDGSLFWNQLIITPVLDDGGQLTHYIGIIQDITESKAMTEELASFKHALDNSLDMIFMADAGTGRFIYVNRGAAEGLGYTEEELLRLHPYDIKPGMTEADFCRITAPLVEGQTQALHLETVHRRKNGSDMPVELFIQLLRSPEGHSRFITIARDLTARKQAEAILQRYEFMVNAVSDMMSVVNRDHCYEAVNDQWCTLLGQKREAVIGAHLSKVWGQEVYAEFIAPNVEQCFREGQPVSLQTSLKLPSTDEREYAITYFPYHAPSAVVTHVVVVTRDITDQVRAQQALQASEMRLRTVQDSMVDGVIVIDERGIVEAFNPAAERIFGYPADEVVGRNVSMLMPEPDRSVHDEHLRHHLQTGERRIIGRGREVQGQRKNGQTFPMDLAVNPMANRGLRCFVGIVRDISERKAADMELIRALETARTASRAKSEFLSSMSHELRTPMNAILGFAQLLEMDTHLGTDHADSVKEILKAGHHLLRLINEVLDLSRIEAGRLSLSMEPVALTELIEECAALVQSGAIRRELTLSRNLEQCQGRWVRADRLRLKQVLLNLLSNAVKYNRHGGSVRIQCGFDTPGRVRLSVNDTGLGIPEDKQDELFTAFHRLGRENSNIEGTGIGLVISKKLMELMGGEIGMESRGGQGSTFWVELPESPPLTYEAPVADGGAPAGTPQETLTNGRLHKVLYVEDNPANLRLMQQALARRPDIRLLTSGEPVKGLELARSKHPHLILLDINLPVMDGYEVLKALQAHADTRGIPVIAITANAMPRDIERGLAAGFKAYLTKPLDLDQLNAEIDRVLLDASPGQEI